MALEIKVFPYQAQLADSVKEQYPGKAFVEIPVESLTNVPAPEANKFLKWNAQGTALENVDGTVNAPSVALTIVGDFPGAPADGDVIILTQAQGNNPPGVYQYSTTAGQWNQIVAKISVPAFPSGVQLPAVATGQFILTQMHNANTPGLYAESGGAWVKIASVYDDQAVRDLITALTGRVTTLEDDNPVTAAAINGQVLTLTFKNATTQDLDLPAGGGAGPSAPLTENIGYGLTAGIADVRADTQQARTEAQNAAQQAFTNNNAGPGNVATQGLRNQRTANPLSGGSLVTFSAPAVPADMYYNPWIIVPNDNLTLFRATVVSGDSAGEDDSDNWTQVGVQNINGTDFMLLVRNTEIESDLHYIGSH